MNDTALNTYQPALQQAQHWTAAAKRLADLDALASDQAWQSMERYLQLELREKLSRSVQRLVQTGELLTKRLRKAEVSLKERTVQLQIEALRKQYMKVETLLDFFAGALASRTTPGMVAMLRACDLMAEYSMKAILPPLGYTVPPVLVYLEPGLGAAIMKAGLRLWDGYTYNPVAAIKVVRHNLLRPTALVHEAGHQIAHITGWNQELEAELGKRLTIYGEDLSQTWASWSPEIAADAFGFVHTGFASVASLHDVVDGPGASVFRFFPGDPHPISFLRLLLGIECCRLCFGHGPWDEMRMGWLEKHDIGEAAPELQPLLKASVKVLPLVADIILNHRFPCFKGRALTGYIDPAEVHPDKLAQASKDEGKSFYHSQYLLSKNPLQRLAWNGYQIVTEPENVNELLRKQENWMLELGKSVYN